MSIKSDTGPFSIVPEWVLDADVSDRAIRLYTLLGRYADKKGHAHPSRSTLAARLRCSVDSLDRAAKELIEGGMLKVTRRKVGNGRNLTNVYLLRMAARARPRSREDAERGCRTGAAENETQENENTLRVVSDDTGPKIAALVAAYVEASQAAGHDPTSRERSRAGRELKRLFVGEHRDYEHLTVVARIMGTEGKSAGLADELLGDVERAVSK